MSNLFLASQLKDPTTLAALLEFAPEVKQAKVMYIPSAANSELGFGVWKTGGTLRAMQKLCKNLEVVELEFEPDERCQKVLQESNILILAGGFPVYLLYWLERRGLVDLIKQRLTDGMKLVGTSAGAAVCTHGFSAARILESEPFSNIIPGMGLVDYEIFPHFEDKYTEVLTTMKAEQPSVEIRPLRDGEQIIDQYPKL